MTQLLRSLRQHAMVWLGLLVVLVLLEAFPAAVHADPPATATLSADEIEDFIGDYSKRTSLPGAVFTVTRDDEVVATGGVGHRADGQLFGAQTPVPIASLSKAMTAAALMQLVDHGRIGLDTPVRHYLPELVMADDRVDKITVRDLLNQRSGLTDETYPDLKDQQPTSLAEVVGKLSGRKLGADPGTSYRYHNTNYALLGRLIEKISGQPFERYLRDNLFKPLGLSNTTTVDQTRQMPDSARGYLRAYGTTIPVASPQIFVAGAYGVVTTAADMARWLIAINPDTPTNATVLSSRARRLMQTPPQGSDYAMGWWQATSPRGTPLLQHTGELFTYNSAATYIPGDQIGLAVITNTGTMSGDDASEIMRGLVDLADGQQPRVHRPFTMTADPILGGVAVAAIALGIIGTVRSPRWARRRANTPVHGSALRLTTLLAPIALLIPFSHLSDVLTQRSTTILQTVMLWPALSLTIFVGALAAASVLITRTVNLLLQRRRS